MCVSKENIEFYIKKQKLKKGIIAKRMGMTAPTFIKRMKNPDTFTVEELQKLASILYVPLWDLFEGVPKIN